MPPTEHKKVMHPHSSDKGWRQVGEQAESHKAGIEVEGGAEKSEDGSELWRPLDARGLGKDSAEAQ